jgi:hypothetical protein
MNKKSIFSVSYFTIFLLSFLLTPAYSNPVLVVDASSSKGKWDKGVITSRKVVFTNRPSVKSEVKVYIENPGKYQLFLYVHHNYRGAIPCIYVEVSNDKGILYNGSHRIENIWYLDKDSPGRWFMVSLTQEPYWEVPKGKLTIRFWVDAFKTIWGDQKTSMEGQISIDKFFLIPIEESESGMDLSWFISPGSDDKSREIVDYYPQHATDSVRTDKDKGDFFLEAYISQPGYYRLGGSVFSTVNNNLNISINGESDMRQISIAVTGADTWSFVYSSPIYLIKGRHVLEFPSTGLNQILIDFLLLTPCTKERG